MAGGRQQGDPGRQSRARSRKPVLLEWRQGGRTARRPVRDVEGSQLGRAQGAHRVAHGEALFRRPRQCCRALSAQGFESLSRRPAPDPQMAGPVGCRPLFDRGSCCRASTPSW
ncbi:hypothetical protein DdX_19901 [Ditylenchus destructor]|uniref:Uncharacterized protein n=1 Tax=Ditylenchus destructor TaxID=166010 RepID=A0AAD4MLU2_9BILA|nr:hypothetical protein DdX_19901 [Ditylenchus destructor]